MSKPVQPLVERLQDEADLCRNDGADDIAALLDEAVAEIRGLMQTLRDELDENLRLRELGGALPDENITAMTERLIRERDSLRAAINEALPFTMTAGQQTLMAALGPNVGAKRPDTAR